MTWAFSLREPVTVAVDVQHVGKPAPDNHDTGARFVRPDGLHVSEAELSTWYADGIAGELERAGAAVVRDLSGWYWTRAREAKRRGASILLACHVNAGRGTYPQAGYWNSSRKGAQLANMVAFDVGRLMQPPGAVRAVAYGMASRGRSTIRTAAAIGLTAVLLEPFFGDNPAHLAQFGTQAGARRLGETIGAAVLDWWQFIAPERPPVAPARGSQSEP